jgi:hypothetical protein
MLNNNADFGRPLSLLRVGLAPDQIIDASRYMKSFAMQPVIACAGDEGDLAYGNGEREHGG